MTNQTDSPEYVVSWRGMPVGFFRETESDMWYIDGDFVKADNKEAHQFVALVRALEWRVVYADATKGTRITLFEKHDSAKQFEALVMAMHDNQLSIRGVYTSEGIAWLRANVK